MLMPEGGAELATPLAHFCGKVGPTPHQPAKGLHWYRVGKRETPSSHHVTGHHKAVTSVALTWESWRNHNSRISVTQGNSRIAERALRFSVRVHC